MNQNSSVPSEMRGVTIREAGGPDVLRVEQCDVPQAGPEQVLVEVYAAGVNRPDCLQRAGLYPVPPDASPLPGLEIAGVVVAVGDAVTRWQPGDRVVALVHGGGYAEYCLADAGHCLPWPDGLSAEAAATLPETCFTVHHNLLERGRMRAMDSLLVHGGSSGIGTTAIQIAKAMGAVVITTAGSDEKCDYCLKMGADHAINYREEDFEKRVPELIPGGVNVVLDMVAGPYVKKNIRVLAEEGRYVMVAFLQGAVVEFNFAQLLTKRLSVFGSTLRPQSVANKRRIASAVLDDIWPWVNSGKVYSHIHASFPLEDASAAHELMESSQHMGKLVLSVKGN